MNGASAPSAAARPIASGPGAGASVALNNLMSRVGAELDHLTGLALQMQTALSDAMPEGQLDPHDLVGLQAIDRISQSLADLAQLMHSVADSLPMDSVISTARIRRAVILFDLSCRLVEEARPLASAPCERAAQTGEVDWL
ncbi:MAG TPA: hypothetical protein PK450_00365 [Paracoccaceae bacterium]|nr:hypothetical protein [Paracoccaceae bacterium]